MIRLAALAALATLATACGGGPSCDLPAQWSSARSGDGSTCQVDIFAPSAHAVYCGGTTGNWRCACGPAADNPPEFTSADFCDLDGEERVCQAIARCGFAL